jgi:hypothetical protein
MPNFSVAVLWRSVAILGIFVLAISLAGFSIDFVTGGQFEFIGDNSVYFFFPMMGGLFFVIFGLIGWAKRLGTQGRTIIGTIACIAPIVTCLLASRIKGSNTHGPFIFFFLLATVPILILGLVLLIATSAPAIESTFESTR